MYLHKKNEVQCTYCVHIVLENNFVAVRWDTVKVRDRFGGTGRFKGGLRCTGWVNSVIINVTR